MATHSPAQCCMYRGEWYESSQIRTEGSGDVSHGDTRIKKQFATALMKKSIFFQILFSSIAIYIIGGFLFKKHCKNAFLFIQ